MNGTFINVIFLCSRLDQMQKDALLYVRRNMGKIELAAKRLQTPARLSQCMQRKMEEVRDRQGWYAPP